ncbi:MAG: sensor histidine kinase, partial [Diaphorobacter nitroreducens]
MQETQILSTRPAALPEAAPRSAVRGRALVFDACQVGVVLRAVLFVELVLGVGALFAAGSLAEWLARLALLTGGALPATLAWLITACSLKTALQRLQEPLQYAAGVLLGALAGLLACAMLALA